MSSGCSIGKIPQRRLLSSRRKNRAARLRRRRKKVEKYVAFDFWNDRFIEPFTELKTTVPKESCKILAVRAVEERPILLSTSRHITQGMLEVRSERWNAADETLEIVTEIPHGLSYELRVYDPIAAELKRWNAPKELSGETTVLYDAKTGAFSVR